MQYVKSLAIREARVRDVDRKFSRPRNATDAPFWQRELAGYR
jgi:hypothetical protein